MAAPGYYIKQQDIADALGPTTYLAIFDDQNAGAVASPCPAVQNVIKRAHAEVMSFLMRVYETLPKELPLGVPDLLWLAELDLALALSIQRHPEYVRSYGDKDRVDFWKRGMDRLENIATAVQQVPNNDTAFTPAAADGVIGSGVIYSGGEQRMIIQGIDGQHNGGDFG